MSGAAREKTQDDVDLERAFDLFDRAFTSNDQRVKDAFRSLMVITALTDNETSDQKWGPFRIMVNDIHELRKRIAALEQQLQPRYSKEVAEKEWEETMKMKAMMASAAVPPVSLTLNSDIVAKIKAKTNKP